MPASLAKTAVSRHPVLPDTARGHMAKADVRIPDVAWGERIGRAIERAIAVVGWSKKEAASKVGVDDAEFGKWLSGNRRPQFDRLFAIEELREPLVVSLAGLAADVRVKTTIEFPERRPA
jgi:DNA-binding transcriptional regulator YdaS (Cro superfamily)